jgi:hypothetical protein
MWSDQYGELDGSEQVSSNTWQHTTAVLLLEANKRVCRKFPASFHSGLSEIHFISAFYGIKTYVVFLSLAVPLLGKGAWSEECQKFRSVAPVSL